MRTKTLLITAALGAAGVASGMAQVYSVNAVGYVNVELKTGYNLVANPLDAGTGNNIVSKLLASVPDGTSVYKYNQATGFNINPKDFGDWDNPAMPLVPGEGAFIRCAAPLTVTFVGEVMQGTGANALKQDIPSGYAIVSSKVPQAGKVSTDLKYPAADGDSVYKFDATTQGYNIFAFDFGSWDPAEPTIAVGEAFWSRKVAAATWTREFSVN